MASGTHAKAHPVFWVDQIRASPNIVHCHNWQLSLPRTRAELIQKPRNSDADGRDKILRQDRARLNA